MYQCLFIDTSIDFYLYVHLIIRTVGYDTIGNKYIGMGRQLKITLGGLLLFRREGDNYRGFSYDATCWLSHHHVGVQVSSFCYGGTCYQL